MARVYNAAGNPQGLSSSSDREPAYLAPPRGDDAAGGVHGRLGEIPTPSSSGASTAWAGRWAAGTITRQLGREPQSPDVAVDAAGNAVVVWAVAGSPATSSTCSGSTRRISPRAFRAFPSRSTRTPPIARNNPRVALDAAGRRAGELGRLPHGEPSGRLGPPLRRPERHLGSELGSTDSASGYQQGSAPILYPSGNGAVVYSDLTAGKILVRRVTPPARSGDLHRDRRPGGGTHHRPGRRRRTRTGGGPGRLAGEDLLVHARFFDCSWSPLAPEFPGRARRDPTPSSDPAVAAGGCGGFAVAWTSDGPRVIQSLSPSSLRASQTAGTAARFGVFAQRFASSVCAAGSEVLCLAGGRFQARVSWKNPYTGETGTGKALPLTGDTGAFWFFDAGNLELMVKVLDGRAVNGHFWVFYGSLSNVEYTLTVTDTATGAVKTYHNPPFQFASRADVDGLLRSTPRGRTPLRLRSRAAPGDRRPGEGRLLAAGTALPRPPASASQNRFEVEVDFIDPRDGAAGQGQAVPLTDDTGAFWFFEPANLELMVKVLDGRGVNGHFWVFYGALSDVEYTITVTDTRHRGDRRPTTTPATSSPAGRTSGLRGADSSGPSRLCTIWVTSTSALRILPRQRSRSTAARRSSSARRSMSISSPSMRSRMPSSSSIASRKLGGSSPAVAAFSLGSVLRSSIPPLGS